MSEPSTEELFTQLHNDIRALLRELEADLAVRQRFNETLTHFLRAHGFPVP